jgi:hypothetical protein
MAKGMKGQTEGPGGAPGGKSRDGNSGSDGAEPGPSNQSKAARTNSPQAGQAGDGSGAPIQSPEAPATAAGPGSGNPKQIADRLFKPEEAAPDRDKNKRSAEASGGGSEGAPAGNADRLGKTGRSPDKDDSEVMTRTEKEAAANLRHAVQRIKADRERRGEPVQRDAGSSAPETKRDW